MAAVVSNFVRQPQGVSFSETTSTLKIFSYTLNAGKINTQINKKKKTKSA